jgi:hypothetical protein
MGPRGYPGAECTIDEMTYTITCGDKSLTIRQPVEKKVTVCAYDPSTMKWGKKELTYLTYEGEESELEMEFLTGWQYHCK